MSAQITALVLLAALMHASWNALLKASPNSSLSTALLVGTGSVLSAPLIFFVPAPASESWPYLVASWGVHQIYFALVGMAYRKGDLSYTYPLMRGLPPMLVACAGVFVLEDRVSPWLWAGVFTLSVGVLWIGGFGRMLRNAHGRSTGFAVTIALLIAAYTLIDGIGARAAGNAASYGFWLFFTVALPYVPIVVARHPGEILQQLRPHAARAITGAVLSIGAYLIVLWAMTQAPLAAVAALRETSVIFAAIIGAMLLKEPFGAERVAGACIVVLGVALLKL